MSAVDNLIANYDKIAFTSYFSNDKVAMYSTLTDSSGEGIGIGASLIATAPASAEDIQLTTASIPNPYGRRCLMTLSWSLDRINFYPMNTPIFYFNATFQEYLWQALAFGGCSDSTIYFGVDSQYTSSQTVYFQFALDSPT